MKPKLFCKLYYISCILYIIEVTTKLWISRFLYSYNVVLVILTKFGEHMSNIVDLHIWWFSTKIGWIALYRAMWSPWIVQGVTWIWLCIVMLSSWWQICFFYSVISTPSDPQKVSAFTCARKIKVVDFTNISVKYSIILQPNAQ